MGKLSHELLDLGFFSALGTTEREGLQGRQTVGRRTPCTMDHNNGVLVIYDERGWPWIAKSGTADQEVVRKLAETFSIKIGAYVPHSNDGGYFIRTAVPALMGDLNRQELAEEEELRHAEKYLDERPPLRSAHRDISLR